MLEIGTLGGYSTIRLARAVPADGSVVTLEIDPRHAEVARANVDAAGVGDRVEILVGPAVDTLATLTATLATDPRFECSTVQQTLDVRGWDGMLLARRV